MKKKIIISLVVVLILAIIAGGFLWRWQEQKDVRELNKDLPEGVRVVKSLFGEYRVVNKIDGYEFKVPREWRGIEEVDYFPERPGTKKYNVAGVNILGLEGETRLISIDQYKTKETVADLESWAKELLDESGIFADLIQDKIANIEVLKLDKVLPGIGYIYFLRITLRYF